METEGLILVIGAGPVGLGMAKALAEAGIPFCVAEATDHVGGNWAHGVYTTAHIISSKRTTEYPDWPMPDDYPDFPSAAQMCAYYDAFADAHGLREHIRFESPVASVVPAGERWRVTFEGGAEETFKGVMVCNGHHWDRDMPAWTADYAGDVIHSKDYKEPEQLRGKRVLVLGGGNSGCDVASEAARVGASCDWSLRRGVWILPKTLFGSPSVELTRGWVPLFVSRLVLRILLAIRVGPFSAYRLPKPDHRIFDAHPTVNDEILHYLKHGRVTPRPGVTRVDGRTVEFADGRRAEYDLVVCATGYRVAFPFLPEGFVTVRGKCPELVAGFFVPHHRNLFIVGAYQVRYGVGPLIRPIGLLLARWVRLQDRIRAPLSRVLLRLGAKPPTSHLVDAHGTIRKLKWARRLDPLVRWTARRMRP